MSRRFYSRKRINVKRFIPFVALCLLLICTIVIGIHVLVQKTKISYDDSILGSAYADSEMPIPTATPKPTVPPDFIVEPARHEADFIDIYNQYEQRIAYLTFDDGPTANITPQMLDILKEKDVPAAFFVTGHYAGQPADRGDGYSGCKDPAASPEEQGAEPYADIAASEYYCPQLCLSVAK